LLIRRVGLQIPPSSPAIDFESFAAVHEFRCNCRHFQRSLLAGFERLSAEANIRRVAARGAWKLWARLGQIPGAKRFSFLLLQQLQISGPLFLRRLCFGIVYSEPIHEGNKKKPKTDDSISLGMHSHVVPNE
jgi:hypothetical protein